MIRPLAKHIDIMLIANIAFKNIADTALSWCTICRVKRMIFWCWCAHTMLNCNQCCNYKITIILIRSWIISGEQREFFVAQSYEIYVRTFTHTRAVLIVICHWRHFVYVVYGRAEGRTETPNVFVIDSSYVAFGISVSNHVLTYNVVLRTEGFLNLPR